jgi:hypothetical protein
MLLNDRIEIKAVHQFNYPVSGLREVSYSLFLYSYKANDVHIAYCSHLHFHSLQTKKNHIPPKLPADIPEELHNVIGPPTDKQMKAVHHALQCIEDRSNG